MGVIISYKGTTISNLTNTTQMQLDTAGKYCEDNISVAYTGPDIEITSPFGDNAFKGAVGLTSITGVSPLALGASCFQNCTGLITISGFSNVATMGSSCFNGCTSLQSVSGFDSLTEIPASAFYGCTALTTLPTEPTITAIGAQAFRGCTSLIKFEMPTNITSLANQIFYGCSALTDIVLHGTVTSFGTSSQTNSITNGCTNLVNVTLPGGSYGSYVLYNNKKIETITVGGLGNPVSSINNSAFYGCNGRACAFTVYTENAQEISHNASNYWGNNASGTTCTFKDSNGVAADLLIGPL